MVHECLPCGAENAITTKELVRLLDFKSARELQEAIARERDEGHLILSASQNGGGYFLPDDDDEKGQAEIRTFIHTLENRAINTLRAIEAAKAALD